MKWIYIKDKHPKDTEKVLVWFVPYHGVASHQFGFWDEENNIFHVPATYLDKSHYEVHYWTPLPPKPTVPGAYIIDEGESCPYNFIDITTDEEE